MHSLRFKFIAPFLLGAIILTLSLSWYSYSSVRYTVGQDIQVLSEDRTRQVVKSITQFLNNITGSLHKIASDPNMLVLFSDPATHPPGFAEHIQQWLDVIIQGSDHSRNIYIVDANGICIAAHSSLQLGVSYADRPYVRDALKGIATFGDIKIGAISYNLSAAAANPVIIDNMVVGAVVAIHDYPDIISYQNAANRDLQAMSVAFLSPEGRFMAHRNRDFTKADQDFSQLYEQLSVVGRQGGAVSFEIEGKSYLGFAQLEPISKWLVITSGLTSELMYSASKIGRTVFIISFIIMCIICFVVIKVAGSLLTSLLSLITYAKDVSEHKLETVLPLSRRKDELGVLHNSLKTLVESLRDMVHKSEEASTMKSQFLANMSHEIRTPLNAIVGMTYLALSDKKIAPAELSYMENIQVAAKALLGIINNILDISKIEANMFELEYTPFNLHKTINDIFLIHKENARAKGISFDIRYSPDMPVNFLGDPTRLGQVVNNLVSNAIKFTGKGGVEISCDCTSITDDKHAHVEIKVADSGIGIDPDVLEALFQPFIQADASITRQFGGTGLGLAISDRIAKMMHGSLVAESEPGKGTVFTFTVELDIDKHPVHMSGSSLHDAFQQLEYEGKRILIAEDNKINQIVLKRLLTPTKARIDVVENGALAVEAIRKNHYDIVFMDMQMPVMGGIEASRIIRTFADKDTLPIIAATANAFKNDKDEAIAAGLNDYITKPIEPTHLFKVLRKWLGWPA